MQFPDLVADRGYAAQALNPPRNKIERLISTREIDTVLRHPFGLDLDAILELEPHPGDAALAGPAPTPDEGVLVVETWRPRPRRPGARA